MPLTFTLHQIKPLFSSRCNSSDICFNCSKLWPWLPSNCFTWAQVTWGDFSVISWGRQWLGWWIISNITDLELIWHIEIQSISPYLVLVPCWVTPLLHSVGKGHMSTTSPIPTKIMSWKLGISRLLLSLKSETRLFGCGSKGKPNPHRFRPF